ncbi:MAG: hypothetical protein H6799_01845 [Candidatus Nomurabacteria bacterium]|nr:MAG: hypothetical protein H6799_01845 [Candidatus Nomurabacteria bacterium]
MVKFKKLDNKGSANPLLLGLIACGILLVVSLIFGLSQMSKVSDYKKNFDSKVSEEVAKQSQVISEQKQAEFDEKEKAPYKFWTSPTQYGSIKVGFPKTWSYYLALNEASSSGEQINLYAYPDYVPEISRDTKYALRMTLETDDYNSVLNSYRKKSAQDGLEISTVQVSNVSGIKIRGALEKDTSGTLVVFPIRDKVLTVWTESKDYESDFENIVLKNLSFIP